MENSVQLISRAHKYKSGNKIHIKKANRGKFTEYCGGKVTQECINRGKNSPDPKIRKRATFAQNSRRWKHQDGGVLHIEASPEYNEYLKYKSLSPEEQEQYRQKNEERNTNIAKSYIKTPTIPNLYKAAQAYFAPVAPENPYQQTGYPTILPTLSPMRAADLITREAPALKSLINQAENIGTISIEGGKSVSKIRMVPDALQKVFKTFPNFQKNLQKFFRTKDTKLLQQLESNARQVIGNADDYLPKGSLLDDAATQVAEPLEGLTVRKVTPGNFQNYVSNLAEREAAKDFAKAYPNIPVATKAPVGRPSKEVMQEIMYPDSYKQWVQKKTITPTKVEVVEQTVTPKHIESKTAKLTQGERYKERKEFSRALRIKDKQARAYEYGDSRITNSGRSRMRASQDAYDWESLGKYGGTFGKEYNKIEKKLKMFDKGSFGYKQAIEAKKQLLEEWRRIYRKKNGGSLLPKFQQGSAMDAMLQMYQQSDESSRKLADIDQKAKEERAMKQQMKNQEMASKGYQLGQVAGEAAAAIGKGIVGKKADKIASTLTDEKILEFQGLKTDDEREEFFRKNKIKTNFFNQNAINNAISNRQVPEPVQAASPTSQTPKTPAQKTPAAVTNSTEIIPADDPLNANAANNNPIAPIDGFTKRLLNQFGFLRLGGKALIPRNHINK